MRRISLSRPVRRIPFAGSIPNDLQREYFSLPWSRRLALVRKAWAREFMLLATRQRRLRRSAIPTSARRILWVYSWTTIGDAIMDLSQCALIPRHIEVDLCIAPHLADLFQGDPRFAAVYRSVDECRDDYDFILLHNASTPSLKLKMKHFPRTPFDTVFGHLHGECFSRADFVARRLGQLLAHPADEPVRPSMPALLIDDMAVTLPQGCRIAVALGGRDRRRKGPGWSAILPAIADAWPADAASPMFVLLGDQTAMDDLGAMCPAFVARHCEVLANRLTLRETAAAIRDCDAFLGVDGGLMHIALAFDKPGLGLFTLIRPEWRMHPDARMHSHFREPPLSTLAPQDVAQLFLASLSRNPTQNPNFAPAPSRVATPSAAKIAAAIE